MLPDEGPPKRVAGADTWGAGEGAPKENAGLFSVVLPTVGVAGEAPNEKGDFAGVAGGAAAGAVDAPNENPPEPPEEVEGNRGFGASIVGVGVAD